jgi:hypothetical protein
VSRRIGDWTVEQRQADKQTMNTILTMDEDAYIGIQYSQTGLIHNAWRNPDFFNETLNINYKSQRLAVFTSRQF